jgi:hypothetical protein
MSGRATPTRASRPTNAAALFGFVQLEFGFLLGTPDGRYLTRAEPDGPTEAVLVLSTLGAPERRRLGGRRARAIEEAEPTPVPTSRATVVRPEPFDARAEASAWLAALRDDREAALTERDAAVRVLNFALRAQRAARADPYIADVSGERSLVARIGFGRGDAVAGGRFAEALELPRAAARRVTRSMEAPEERFAALLGAREQALVAEELVLRARIDLNARRSREAALQARVALEALMAELPRADLARWRETLGEAANAALRGEPDREGLKQAVEAMEAVLRRHRLRG